ncbi:hypothetical protein KCU89_g4201, partial [Aureobasidium melanogenum]
MVAAAAAAATFDAISAASATIIAINLILDLADLYGVPATVVDSCHGSCLHKDKDKAKLTPTPLALTRLMIPRTLEVLEAFRRAAAMDWLYTLQNIPPGYWGRTPIGRR